MSDKNLKDLLKDREKNYLESTQKILEIFLPQLNESIQEVIYDGEPINILVKGIYPIVDNLQYVSIIVKVSQLDIGDTVDLVDDDGQKKELKITKDNYWSVADLITLNAPISVLETQDSSVISKFMREEYEENPELNDMVENENFLSDTESSDENNTQENIIDDFDKSQLDNTQQKLLGLYNNKQSGNKH